MSTKSLDIDQIRSGLLALVSATKCARCAAHVGVES